MKKNDPEIGDLAVCTVKEVRDFGVICSLDEFPGKEGFIHITEISSGWIKYTLGIFLPAYSRCKPCT